MKAVVLSAGKGVRLRALTEALPKPMLPVHGKPVLEHHIELLRLHGIREVCINLHHRAEAIRGYFQDGKKWGVQIHYAFEPELLGTAGAVKNFETVLGKDRFLVIYGDNFTNYNLSQIVDFHLRKEGLAAIAVFEKEDVSSSGVVWLDSDGKVIKFVEKPKDPHPGSKLVNAGIYVFEPEIFGHIPSGKFSDFGSEVFPSLLAKGKSLYAIVMKGTLEAIDTPELYYRVSGSHGGLK